MSFAACPRWAPTGDPIAASKFADKFTGSPARKHPMAASNRKHPPAMAAKGWFKCQSEV
jgi:hypothetical protein